MGLFPKLEKSRLNQTTSGRKSCMVRSSFAGFAMSSKDQQRTTSNSSNSGSGVASWSAKTVTLSRGSRCSSRAMWYPYSFKPRRLGGNAETKQIFMGPQNWLLKQRQTYHRSEDRLAAASEIHIVCVLNPERESKWIL